MEIERRLAAILAADLVGYRGHMSADEEGTLRRLTSTLSNIVRPEIESRGGRIVKTTGDGFLAEFGSVLNAFNAALAIQSEMNSQQSAAVEPSMYFRIGINVGEIIFSDTDIFGDGVNVAARLEGLAEAGGITVSDRAWADLKRTKVEFIDRGERQLKNMPHPVRVFSVDMTNHPEPDPPPPERLSHENRHRGLLEFFTSSSIFDLARLAERSSWAKRDSIIMGITLVFGALAFLVAKLLLKLFAIII